MPLTPNVTSSAQIGNGPDFVTDAWNTDPDGPSQVPMNKLMFGARGVDYEVVADADGSRLPVLVGQGPSGTLVDGSAVIANANASQMVFAANPNRKYLLIVNLHASAVLWINFTSVATEGMGSVPIAAGTSFKMTCPEYVSSEVINAISSQVSLPYTAKEG